MRVPTKLDDLSRLDGDTTIAMHWLFKEDRYIYLSEAIAENKPRGLNMVISSSSIEECVRDNAARGESDGSMRERKAVVWRGLPDDPLGYDTGDFRACALAMAEAALSGRNRTFVQTEIEAIKKRFESVK